MIIFNLPAERASIAADPPNVQTVMDALGLSRNRPGLRVYDAPVLMTPHADPGARRFVWVFMGEGAEFPSGIFARKTKAEVWIKDGNLTGTLMVFPLNEGTYQCARKLGILAEDEMGRTDPEYVQRYYSSRQENYHYVKGSLVEPA
jgi:hypothetical protein